MDIRESLSNENRITTLESDMRHLTKQIDLLVGVMERLETQVETLNGYAGRWKNGVAIILGIGSLVGVVVDRLINKFIGW